MEEKEVSCAFVQNLQRFAEINAKFKCFIAGYNLSELSAIDVNIICLKLADYILDLEYCVQVVDCFRQDFLKILSLAIPVNENIYFENHRKICVILAKILPEHPDAKRFVENYFMRMPAPFSEELDSKLVAKRLKLEYSATEEITDLQIVEACYTFLKHSPEFFRHSWSWSKFVENYFEHDDSNLKWFSCQCIAILTGMNEKLLNNLLHQSLSENESRKHYINQEFKYKQKDYSYHLTNDSDFNEVHIPIYQKDRVKNQSNIIEVESTKNNLRKISLGIAANKAVALIGPVGSGKTTLVEYLAAKTGRLLGESMIKIQLGDQTDSKMLLGTYRCTDIPGEFVWQPGVLTQAVVDGSWMLLEDIDSASVDVTSVLSSILENGYLTVPGYRDAIPVAPGFQLFVTQRLIGHHRKHTNATSILDKHSLQVNLDPLTPNELEEIVNTLYPILNTVCLRMVKIFTLFSCNEPELKSVINLRGGRLISTRDLFKWCARAVVDFDVSSQNSAMKVLQDAIDIFCCSFSSLEERLNLAKEISTHLGIINEKAVYFCNQYKPSLSLSTEYLAAGRASIKRENKFFEKNSKFCFTRPAACLLERIMCCIQSGEPVLLVGETGTGKTSSVQYLANIIGQKLVVINMNQQSDSADLLGGFKPIDTKFIVRPVKKDFENVFHAYFNVEQNKQFLRNIAYCYNKQRYGDLVKLMKKSYEAAIKRLTIAVKTDNSNNTKLQKHLKFLNLWMDLGKKLQKLELQLKQKNSLAFAFIEGSLVKAIENGYWVLLDEINLANAETLECLSGLLEGPRSSLNLLERGDKKPIKRHENFTLFACMNPSTDIGKKDLPAGLRNRFTEFFVDELTEKNDLALLVNSYLEEWSLSEVKTENIVKFYLTVRKEAVLTLSDGLGHKPHFSLRSLCRALTIASKNPCGSFVRSLYESFCLSFLTQLDLNSCKRVEALIIKYIVGSAKEFKSVINQSIPSPDPSIYLQFEGYWVAKGSLEPKVPEDYILTSSVRRNLKDLVRVVSIGRLPVLLQGDTSIGKTSLIMYLAKCSGNKCVRINNHEHTDLQEYIGSYIADASGKLVFKEGLLVEAMRKGHWIILDELNLAPTDVLEALNRVLDDNRELFIPETQETIKAHPKFMLFATQNPPGAYGGRKMLSRAFRNRFVELHFNEIPPDELEFILHKRCQMAPSYAKKMVNVMKDLQTRRRGSAAFAGKHGFITFRDLFRWGERYRLAENKSTLYDWDQHLSDEGFLVLAGRVRKSEERDEIIQVIKKHMKREVVPKNLFTLSDTTSPVTRKILEAVHSKKEANTGIVWTYNMQQHAVMVSKAMQFYEPVLLVGETGSGKTTICKILAENNGQDLVTVNCHMHTESSDFIGGLRPVRTHASEDLNKLFEWCDGPLIQAMVQGNVFLADEISLADDSVLERLNSLLEPERTMLLAEKGIDINNKDNSELIIAHKNFHFIGTMNPGGDFGKKELSPALRNRFTEIWCDSHNSRQDLIDIIEHNIRAGISLGNQEDGSTGIGKQIMDFIDWFSTTDIGKRFTISVRDILTWVNFMNNCGSMEPSDAFLHGACLTFLDSLGSGVTSIESRAVLDKFRTECIHFISQQIKALNLRLSDIGPENLINQIKKEGAFPFTIEKGNFETDAANFSFDAPTTLHNAVRLVRGLQLNKAILLEGSPGVGKTSIVTALAKASKKIVFRVNLSDQTDISDLFGADLPVEGGKAGQFAWKDGPLLQALKRGYWILLDELNLAPQSVLEGLNACLDHRGEIFIPELGKTFRVKPGTRFFACQNPTKQGGSRRGLPKSFLNRFTQVYMSPLNENDFLHILKAQFPILPDSLLERMVNFNQKIVMDLEKQVFGYKGGPWEYNLRDLTRWCEATIYHYKQNADECENYAPEFLMELIYNNRLRSVADRRHIAQIFETIFGKKIDENAVTAYVTSTDVHLGDVCLKRELNNSIAGVAKQETSLVLRSQLSVLRSLAYCVNLNWMSILVGSAGCGKTSVVRTLASLCGKTLHTLPVNSAMDTSDLLGGFEQTDYTRHLEEISKQTEQLVYLTVQKILVRKEKSRAIELLRSWENSSQLLRRVTQNQTLLEETNLFLEKIDSLNKLWTALLDCDLDPEQKQMITNLQSKAQSIRASVKEERCLNAGGKFEWVDSILVKCLVNGSWLLIDNVNLCNPAVLDRLNALLEPNGTLIIGERGIDENGKMVEIKPHKDFRLFLTMDPKNGEISRAMRNRGIEIYMLNESEEFVNILDIKSLMIQNGLTDQHIINLLFRIHGFISDLILGEKPNINHILQSSFLIAQQLKRGISTHKAIHNTILDVYYKTRFSYEFSRSDAQALIQAELDKLLNFDDIKIYLCDYDATLKTLDLQQNSALSKIKQQIVVLNIFLQTDDNHLGIVEHFLMMHFYSITSSEDLEMRQQYFEKYADINKFHSLKNLIVAFYNEVIIRVRCNSLPFDSRWLRNLPSETSKGNKLLINLYFICHKLLIKKTAVEEIKGEKGFTLWEYMVCIKNKKIDGTQIDDVVIKNLLDLLEKYDTFFITLFRNENVELRDDTMVNVLSLLQWRFLLQEVLEKNVVSNMTQANLEEVIKDLHLHYKWFYKYSVAKLNEIFPAQKNDDVVIMVEKINSGLPSEFSDLKELEIRYQKANRRPPPLVNNQQIISLREYNEIAKECDLYVKENDLSKVLNIVFTESDLMPLLIDVKAELGYDFLDAPDNLNQLKHLYKKIQNMELVNHYKQTDVNLLPIIDYFALLSIYKARSSDFFNNGFISTETLPPSLLGVLKRNAVINDNRLHHEIIRRTSQYLMTCASLHPSKFLNFGSQKVLLDEVELHFHQPVLTYLITNVLVSSERTKIVVFSEFGNYRNTENQCHQINTMLWKNMQQMSSNDYDYAYLEIKYLQASCRNILNDIALSEDKCNSITVQKLFKDLNEVLYFERTSSLTEAINVIADGYINTNHFKTSCNLQLPAIDPLKKTALKKQYCLKEKIVFETLKHTYELQNDVYSNSNETLFTALRSELDKKIDLLNQKNNVLGQNLAVRPEYPTYDSILKEIKHGLLTVLKLDKILYLRDIIEKRIVLMQTSPPDEIVTDRRNCLKLLSPFTHTLTNFVKNLVGNSFLYPDIIEPLVSSITELLYGMRLKASLADKLILQYENSKLGIHLHEDLINVIKFPVLNENQPNSVEAINLYMRDEFQNFIQKSIVEEEDLNAANQEILSLLKCAIQEMYNACVIDVRNSQVLSNDLFLQFNYMICLFVNAYNKQENEREAKSKEAESLYKTRTKCQELSEDQVIEKEFKSLFPNHHATDFNDLQPATLDDEEEEFTDQDLRTDFVGLITAEDLKFVSDLHSQFMCSLTKSEWLDTQGNKVLTCDYVKPLLQKFRLCKLLLNKMVGCLNYQMDLEIMGSLSILTHVAQKFGDIQFLDDVSSPSKTLNKKQYNFYLDSNVEEITNSYHVLEELRLRILQLLQEWPDHPTLQTINSIIQRIYAFDVRSPISRYLTGFEILLTKCNEWEQNAHVGVSLQQHSLNITQQIIAWRKLEMSMWKDALNNSFNRLNSVRSKWWIHFFCILKQFVEKKCAVAELIEVLQQFITKTNLAEFSSRLELLFVFHCHCVHLPKTAETETLVNILWNIYNYYTQFIPVINSKIKELRSPIEKKLRDYVKIVRWKDISYWAVKETLDKTHKIIHKYMREFENLLSQPALPYLVNIPTISNEVENVGIWDRPQRVLMKTYHYAMDPTAYMAKQSLVKKIVNTDEIKSGNEVFLTKVEKYFNKSRLLSKKTVSAVQYPTLIQTLDGFVSDISEIGVLLQKIEVDSTLPKEKQKSYVKNLLHQKRTALAGLFKTLTTIGLSYRTGIIESKQKDATEDFLLKPLDLKTSLSYLSHRLNDKKLLTIWDGCEMYYNKSWMRLDILESALMNPSKDLGPNNIERLKGFALHLMKFNHQQKAKLTESAGNLYNLRFYATYFSEFCDEEVAFLNSEIYDRITAFSKNACVVMEQYKLVLNSCPEEALSEKSFKSIPVLQPENTKSIKYKYDEQWNSASLHVANAVNDSEKILNLLVKSKIFIPRVSSEYIHLKYLPVLELQMIQTLLNSLTDNLNDLVSILGNIPLCDSLKWLLRNLKEIKTILNENAAPSCETNLISKNSVEHIIKKMLFSIQNVYKKYMPVIGEHVVEEDEAALSEQHLKTLIVENLLKDLDQFNINEVLNCMANLAKKMAKIDPHQHKEFQTLLAHALPILEQLLLLYEYFITQQVLAYRVTCKMTSVLLNIFLELATKGFCIPPELSDEIDSEGQQTGGMGLGDGEGEKDVSDRIESEDQLEDTRTAGQEEKQNEDKDCKEEEKGIDFSEDFDSKLQDVEKKPDEENDVDDSESDAEEQMGETEKDAEQLDQQIWGSDDEEEEEEGENEEANEEEGRGNKGQKQGEKELTAKDGESQNDEVDDEATEENKDKQKQKKEINEMEEQEYDDQQIDPYHGNQIELPEPEPMDLPDDVQLDDDEKETGENQEENPFDIDTMKEQLPPKEDKKEDEAMDVNDGKPENENEASSDGSDNDDDEVNERENPNLENNDDVQENETSKEEEEEKKSDYEASEKYALDETETNAEGAQPMDVDNIATADNVQANEANIQKSVSTDENVIQEDKPDKSGVGQAQVEDSDTGHKSGFTAHQESQQKNSGNEDQQTQQKEKRQRPGESDSQRSLGDVDQPAKKKLKTLDSQPNEPETQEKEEEETVDKEQTDAEMYQHIKDATSAGEQEQVIDAATEEQFEQQRNAPNEKENDVDVEGSENLMQEEDEDIEVTDSAHIKPEKLEGEKQKRTDKAQHPDGDVIEDVSEVQIDGEIIKTTTVPRGGETTHHTQVDVFGETTLTKLSPDEINQLRKEVEQQLSTWNEPPTSLEAKQTWEKISSVTLSLAQDLAEQLRLVLEPTQASRLKGDYRTGRRINMRKVIPYIASQFRKDKIWLRRTKPSKREYQIILAIDDSSSMADNHSKELAFESVALISKALSLLESGQLSVLSFGEQTEILHKLTDTFTETTGSKLIQKFQFAQKKTCVARLVDFATEMLRNASAQSQSQALNAKLLIIVSDGRGIFSEGENYVHQAVRRARLSNIFMIFIIVDNPKNDSSILDIRMPVFDSGKLMEIKSYMDSFPFPFYVILRDINSLPNVLSDALKQWFEIVSSAE